MTTKNLDSIRDIHRVLIGVLAVLIVFGFTPDSGGNYKDAKSEVEGLSATLSELEVCLQRRGRALFSENLKRLDASDIRISFAKEPNPDDQQIVNPHPDDQQIIMPQAVSIPTTLGSLREYLLLNNPVEAWGASPEDISIGLSLSLSKNLQYSLTELRTVAIPDGPDRVKAEHALRAMHTVLERERRLSALKQELEEAKRVKAAANKSMREAIKEDNKNDGLSGEPCSRRPQAVSALCEAHDEAVDRTKAVQESVDYIQEQYDKAPLEFKASVAEIGHFQSPNFDADQWNEEPEHFFVEVKVATDMGTPGAKDKTSARFIARAVKRNDDKGVSEACWRPRNKERTEKKPKVDAGAGLTTTGDSVPSWKEPFKAAYATDVWPDLSDRNPRSAEDLLSRKLESRTRKIPLIGVDVPENVLAIIGLPLIALLMAYLFVHVRNLPVTVENDDRNYPWIGLYSDPTSQVLVLTSTLLGPVGVAIWLCIRARDDGTCTLAWLVAWTVVIAALSLFLFKAISSARRSRS